MAIRKDLEDFPFDYLGSGVWYFAQVVSNGEIISLSFISSKCRRNELVELIKSNKGKVLIYGVWTGKYKTDLFEIPSERIIVKFEGAN